MPERNWFKDWDLAISPEFPDWEKYDELQQALRYWLYHYKKLEALEEAVRQHIAWHLPHVEGGPCCCRDEKILEALGALKGGC